MKNYLKSLIILVLLGMFSQSCTEKQNLQNNEFEFETVLKDNKTLLNEVNEIVGHFDVEVETKLEELIDCNNFSEFKEKYDKISNTEKVKVWKNRLIDGIKNKRFTENELKFIVGLYNLFKPELFNLNSKENEYFNNYSIKKLIKDTEIKEFSLNLKLTTMSLTDDLMKIQKICKSRKKNGKSTGNCNCRWGTFCGATFSCGGNCTHVKDFCGFGGVQDCNGNCIQYEQ